jgi:peptidoglycan-associated lipoprotein
MKTATIACLAAATLLAACSSHSHDSAAGSGGGTGAGYAQPGGPETGAGAGSATPGSEEDLVQSAGDRIYFATDKNSLDDQAKAILDRQIAWLQRYSQVNVWVAGNCDERGTEEYNLALGERRAYADRDYLLAHGIARTRIETISYGKSRPVDGASTPEAWTKNRNAITSVR